MSWDTLSCESIAAELEETALQLAEIALRSSGGDRAGVQEQLSAELQRLQMTADMLGLAELDEIAAWLVCNAQCLTTHGDRAAALLEQGSYHGWAELLTAYLQSRDVSLLGEITNSLLEPDWTLPPDPEAVHRLILAAVPGDTATSAQTADDNLAAIPAAADETGESLKLEWDFDVHPELLEAYLSETPGHVTKCSELIRRIADGSAGSEERRQAARLAHTIKGSSGVVGITAISEFTHRIEDVFDHLEADPPAKDLRDLLHSCADCLEGVFEAVQGRTPAPAEFPDLLNRLAEWDARLRAGKPEGATEEAESAESPRPPSLPEFIVPAMGSGAIPQSPRAARPAASGNSITVPLELINRLMTLVGEIMTTTSQAIDRVQKTVELTRQISAQDDHVMHMLDELDLTLDQQLTRQAQKQGGGRSLQFDALELDAFNELHGLKGLIHEALADTRAAGQGLRTGLREIANLMVVQKRANRELNSTVLTLRMVPVQTLVPRLERVVRETCRRTGKQARLEIKGSDLAVDTDILQGMIDPLLHMLRNAVDHGIETPLERERRSKPPEGLIQLVFDQRGDEIVMTLTDDGAGMDVQRIRKRALEIGLIQADQPLAEQETMRLILQPGFSTRTEVTDVSGRGVGMDVVQAAVDRLNGSLHLATRFGEGSDIRIHLPLTLVSTTAIVVRTAGALVAVPTRTVRQVRLIDAADVQPDGDRWTLVADGDPVFITPLAQLLGWPSPHFAPADSTTVLIVDDGVHAHALVVDEVYNAREVVIKSLSPWLTNVTGLSGACLITDGAVAPVLDLTRLLRAEAGESVTPIITTDSAATSTLDAVRRTVLIVDDSLSNRKALSLLVEQLGFTAVTAFDGVDALNVMNVSPPALVCTDLEMPRMNGLELTQAIRASSEMQDIPIVMITSRSAKKHRDQAIQVGVDDYLTKPVDRDTLGACVAYWLGTAGS